jgi:hypothetical protein
MSTSAIEGIGWAAIDRLALCMSIPLASLRQPDTLRPPGWTAANYDGRRPCLPTNAIRTVAARIAKKKGAA